MTQDSRRITLIARRAGSGDRPWAAGRDSANRLIFLEAFTVLRYALVSGVAEMQQDVERVIVDRCSTAAQYLELLTGVPPEFTGDLLYIRPDDSGFLSATGRGGDRVLYALSGYDIRFYLETHDLVTGRAALGLTA